MNVRHRHLHPHLTAIAGAALTAAVLAGTAACTGSSTPTAASTGATGAASASPSSAGTISLPAASGSASAMATNTGAAGSTSGSGGGTTAAGNGAGSGGGTAACRNADVSVGLGAGGAAMSHDGQVLKFTDVSGHACTLQGYPGVAVVSGGRTLLNATRELNGYIGDQRQLSSAPVVTLQPGQSASAELEWEANAGEACYPSGSGLLTVTPPNTTKSASLRAITVGPDGACAGFDIHPVVAGVLAGG